MTQLEDMTEKLALEYLKKVPGTKLTEEKVEQILTTYFGMQQRGTFEDTILAIKTGETKGQITRILNTLGLPITQQHDATNPKANQAHEYIKQNPATKLKIEDIIDILTVYETLAQQGQPKTTDLAEQTGLTKKQIGRVLKAFELPYTHGTNNSNIEEYVEQGLSIQQIADKEGITKQRAQQLINEAGLHAEWKQKREEVKHGKPQTMQRLANALYAHLLQRTQTENPAMYYAITHSRKPNSLPYEKLEQLFTTYFEGKQQGKTPTIYELQEKTGIYFTTLARILRENGLERSQQHKQKETTPEHKKQAMQALHEIGLSTQDISHYLKIPDYTIRVDIRRGDKKLNTATIIGRQRLHVHECEEVYQAQQLGYTVRETAELLDLPEKTIQYALNNKDTIDQKIRQTHEILEAMKC